MLNKKNIVFAFDKTKIIDFSFKLWALITIMTAFVPLSIGMPNELLDSSWMFGMNQAIAQHLNFGKDIIFTFGPYASVYTRIYHPATYHLMIIIDLFIGISYWLAFNSLTTHNKTLWVVVFLLALASNIFFFFDVLLFSYPVIVGLVFFKSLSHRKLECPKNIGFIGFLFLTFGLLPLIKANNLAICLVITVFCTIYAIVEKQKKIVLIIITAPIISSVIFWLISGQSLISLPYYFINNTPIISGYSEAMATNINPKEEIFYSLLCILIFLISIFYEKNAKIKDKLFLFATFSVFLFISFKSSFIRHDNGHAIEIAIALLMASLLLKFVTTSQLFILNLIIAASFWVYIDQYYFKSTPNTLLTNIKSTYSFLWTGFPKEDLLKQQFNKAVLDLKARADFPILSGTTDIYSIDVSYLIASGNQWNPRPILQSYAVYTPALAEINKQHLLNEHAPDNIIFKVLPQDNRMPSIEDGISWPVLLSNYQPVNVLHDYLFLHKKTNNEFKEPIKLSQSIHSFNETVMLPEETDKPIFVEIDIKPTLLGRIASILLKPSQLNILVELKNGQIKKHRIISGMTKSGFLLSPFISDTSDFVLLYGNNNYLNSKLVKSFSIYPTNAKKLWNKEYTVTFKTLEIKPINLSNSYTIDNKVLDEIKNLKQSKAEKCNGSIDMVNSVTSDPSVLVIKSLLKADGWFETPETEFYLVLTDEQGMPHYLKTHRIPRPDLVDYFHNSKFKEAGFRTMTDVSQLNGKYHLGVAIKDHDELKLCPEFNIPITIN